MDSILTAAAGAARALVASGEPIQTRVAACSFN